MNTVDFARAICAALQPLTGPAAAGRLLVHSTTPTATLAAGRFAAPVRGGAFDEAGIAFVAPNPATADGSWTVTSAGVLVDVQAVHGGPIGNSAAGTPYRWDPPLAGIEATSAAGAGGIAGGALLTSFGALRQVRQYKQLDRASLEAFFRAQATDFPAAVIAWESLTPLGGAMGSSPGPRTSRAGADAVLARNTWSILLVASRLDLEATRRTELDFVRDAVILRLHQRTTARGLRLSMSPGVEILEARVQSVTPTSYVDLVRISTSFALRFQHEEAFNDWLRTRIVEETAAQGNAPPIHIVDTTVPMPPDGTVP